MTLPVVRAVRAGLRSAAEPARAEGMREYLKSDLPCLGVYTGQLRRVVREALAAHAPEGGGEWQATIRELWYGAAYREERHAAIGILLARPYRELLVPATLPFVEELIVSGAWWDLVDPLATKAVAQVLAAQPEETRPVVLAWSRSPDVWLRRTSIICQVPRKGDTDLELLYACIEPNLADPDFFVRKAIGWALRQHAWTDPVEVERYVAVNADRLSPLSRREAVKNLGRRG